MPNNDSTKQLHQIVQKNLQNFKQIVGNLGSFGATSLGIGGASGNVMFAEAFNIGKSIAIEASTCVQSARAQILSLSTLGLTSQQMEQVYFQIATHYHWSSLCWHDRSYNRIEKADISLIEKLITSPKEGFLSAQFLQNELGLPADCVYRALLSPICKEVIEHSEKMLQKSHLYAFMFMDEYIVNAPFFFTSVLSDSHDLADCREEIKNPKANTSTKWLAIGAQMMLLSASLLELTSTRANNDERTALSVLKSSLENSVWGSANEAMKLEQEVPPTTKGTKVLPASLLMGNKNRGDNFSFLQKKTIEEMVEIKNEKDKNSTRKNIKRNI